MIKSPTRAQSASYFRKGTTRTEERFYDADYDRSSNDSLNRDSSSPLRSPFVDGSVSKTTVNEAETPFALSKHHTKTSFGGHHKKKKKTSKRFEELEVPDSPKLLTSHKYKKKYDEHEKQINNLSLDDEEEREYMMMLNRNIKDEDKHKKPNDFMDVDTYFNQTIEKRIHDKDTHSRPIEFRKIVKNYAYFLKEEDFDKDEFIYCKKMLAHRKKETLEEVEAPTKYVPPFPKMAEANLVRIEARNLESKLKAENEIKQKNDMMRNLKKDWKKDQTPTIKEPEGRSSGRNLSNILMRHQETFGLKNFGKVMKDLKNKERKIREQMEAHNHMKQLGFGAKNEKGVQFDLGNPYSVNASPSRTQDPSTRKRYAQSTKDMIQGMIEQIEKNLEDEETLQYKIRYGIPLVAEKKVKKEKFLKLGDDLARSTAQLGTKREVSNKKAFEFTDIVKMAKSSSGVGIRISRSGTATGVRRATFKESNLITVDHNNA